MPRADWSTATAANARSSRGVFYWTRRRDCESHCEIVTGLQTPCAGILALSCSLFGFREFDDAALQTSKPVLFCTGEKDPYIPVSEVEADKAFIAGRTKCDVRVRTFKCMGHESCEQELAVCANWLAKVLAVDGDDDALGAAAGVNFIK